MTPSPFVAALQSGRLLLDGGISSQILCSGFDLERDFLGLEHCTEVLSLTRPEQIRAVHESYFDAGARVATTNTFAGAPAVLETIGLADRAREIHRSAVASAAEAVAAWSTPERPLFVLGAIGPAFPDEDGQLPEAVQLQGSAQAQVEWLAEFGADAVLFETVTDLDVLELGLTAAARVAPNLPRCVSAHVEGASMDVQRLERLLALAERFEVALLGLNCTDGPDSGAAPLRFLRERTTRPLGFWPNAGHPEGEGLNQRWPVGAQAFATSVAALITELSLSAAGGCCGSGPAHIAALGQATGWAPPPEPLEDESDAPADAPPTD